MSLGRHMMVSLRCRFGRLCCMPFPYIQAARQPATIPLHSSRPSPHALAHMMAIHEVLDAVTVLCQLAPLLLKIHTCIGSSKTSKLYHSGSHSKGITFSQQRRHFAERYQVSTLTSCALLTSKSSAMGTANLPSALISQIMQSHKSSQTRVTDLFSFARRCHV